MEFIARYVDGLTARVRTVALTADITAAQPDLVIRDPESGEMLDRWRLAAIYGVPSRKGEMRLGVDDRPRGARLSVTDAGVAGALRRSLPRLDRHHMGEHGRDVRVLGLALGALASVIVAYVVGVPLIASRIVALVPPAIEMQVGEAAGGQIFDLLGSQGTIVTCDEDPDSLANGAIARLVDRVLDGQQTPFSPRVDVVRAGVPNAFALPGGQVYMLSPMLEATETPEEFAGVLAHEIGHVVHRHGLESLVATSATGLLVGFVLGDMTGLSVAGGFGSAVIDSRFSRDAETQADVFAAEAAARLGFSPAALGDLLDRVAADDTGASAFSLLSSHPLTIERRTALAGYPEPAVTREVFTDAEWQAIKTMC